jgi:hypothetical protein
MSAIELTNPDFDLAVNFVNQTGKPLFLTGKAGTGKTTFLKYIRENCSKKLAVVAPTGVAAINAGGVTMHSFFQLPFGPYIADYRSGWGAPNMELSNRHTLLKNLRLSNNKRELIQSLELLIIDEVSMLRADMLDAIDTVLRHVRKRYDIAFGGVQVLYIGDLFQLPPVVSREEWQLLNAHYKSPFFFDAQVLQNEPPVYIELKKIYRQKDAEFISVLNSIRNNVADAEDIKILDRRYNPAFSPKEAERYIILTSHNAKADIVNKTELEKLNSRLHVFEGVTKGDFGEKVAPVDKHMLLKEGAQIMFVKNDKGETRRYYNGKIGTISKIELDKIWVRFEGEQDVLELAKETWRNINYKYNQENDEIEEEEIGSFSQYPIRLAWAITIHKSQGLTFERAIVDAAASFAPGQVYVALSRLTSLEGLILHSRINTSQVMTDQRVVNYTNRAIAATSDLDNILKAEQRAFAGVSLLESFEFEKLVEAFQENCTGFAKATIPEKENAAIIAKKMLDAVQQMQTVANKFEKQVLHLLQEAENTGYHLLQERTIAAAAYFTKGLDEVNNALSIHIVAWKLKQRTKKYIKSLQVIQQQLLRKKTQIEQAEKLAQGLNKGTDIGALLTTIAADKKMHAQQAETEEGNSTGTPKKEKGSSNRISLELYNEGKSINEIAEIRSMAVSTIEGHLTSFVGTGEIDISVFVSKEQLSVILKTIQKIGNTNSASIKDALGSDFTYAQIRAASVYHQRLNDEG